MELERREDGSRDGKDKKFEREELCQAESAARGGHRSRVIVLSETRVGGMRG